MTKKVEVKFKLIYEIDNKIEVNYVLFVTSRDQNLRVPVMGQR